MALPTPRQSRDWLAGAGRRQRAALEGEGERRGGRQRAALWSGSERRWNAAASGASPVRLRRGAARLPGEPPRPPPLLRPSRGARRGGLGAPLRAFLPAAPKHECAAGLLRAPKVRAPKEAPRVALPLTSVTGRALAVVLASVAAAVADGLSEPLLWWMD